jgi:hypothetical protein
MSPSGAVAVRVFWPTLRDNVTGGVSVEHTLRELARHAGRLGRRARAIERRRWDGPPDE